MKSLDSLRLGNAEDRLNYSKLAKYVLTKGQASYDITDFLDERGALEVKGEDTMENFEYALTGTAITHVNIVKWAADNALKPGANGSGISVWFKVQLFQEGMDISGPDTTHMLKIVSFDGEVDGLFKYTAKVVVKAGYGNYIPSQLLNPDERWTHFQAASTEEFSFKGPGNTYMAPATRIGYWNSVRYSDKLGGAVANAEVAVFDIESEEIGKSRVFELEVKMRLYNLHNRGKTNAALFGIKQDNYAALKDSNTGQTELRSDGLFTQRGEGNVFEVAKPTIQYLASLIGQKIAADGAENVEDNKFLVMTSIAGADDLISQATKYAADLGIIVQNIDGKSTTNLTAGYRVRHIIFPTFTLDIEVSKALAASPVRTKYYPGTRNPISAYDWEVMSIGKDSKGKASKLYKYINTKHARATAVYGMRGDSAGTKTAADMLAPNVNINYNQVQTQEDASEFSIASDFTLIDKNPNASFVIRRAVL